MKHYWSNVLVTGDGFFNAICGGIPDETYSSRMQRAKERGDLWGDFMIWWLDKIQKHHGILAQEHDLARAEKVVRIEEESLGGKR